MSTRVQRIWLFRKWRTQTLLMGAKLKSKTHLQNIFFCFFEPFLRIWLQSLQKVLKWFWIRWKSCKKMHKKVISKTSLTNMSKSEISAYFRHVFSNNFFVFIFSKLFQRIQNQREILHFLIPILNFLIKIFFFLLLALFVHFECKCAGNGWKKRKIFFMNVS